MEERTEMKIKAATSKIAAENREMAKRLKTSEAEIEVAMSWVEERDATIAALLTKNVSLERRISRLELDLEAKIQALEAERETKVSELVQRIEVLEKEKRELEAAVCEAKREKREIKMILKDKTSLKEKHIMKYTPEAEIRENDEMGNFEVVELPQQQAHPTTQNQGPECVLSDTESKLPKRKAGGPGCYAANHAGTKRCKMDGLKERELVWKNAEDMYHAFTVNDELCMRSVCALYRKYKSMGEWKKRLIPSSHKRFIQHHEARIMALGKLLTSGDPEGRLKQSLAEFKQADPCGLEDCRSIACQHDEELFEMYRKNLDPLFIIGDEMDCVSTHL